MVQEVGKCYRVVEGKVQVTTIRLSLGSQLKSSHGRQTVRLGKGLRVNRNLKRRWEQIVIQNEMEASQVCVGCQVNEANDFDV